MDNFFTDFIKKFREMPLSKKLAIATVAFLIIAGFGSIFLWANKAEYKVLFKELSADDSASIIENLKAKKIPYKLERNGASILVPSGKLNELRIELAGAGLPKGGGVGFEIFDKTDFGTTEFVQKLNYQRALQGELARTIKEIDEVKDARVLLVLPKDSVFVEESKPPSASVFLKLRKKIQPEKVKAIVHLVASAIEDLTPDLVTVIDSKGKVLSKGTAEDDADAVINSQLKYKLSYERNLANRVQSMLENIVGHGKAIVRVSAAMDFSRVNVNEELYDPDTQVVRSKQSATDQSNRQNDVNGKISSVNPVAKGVNTANGIKENKQHQDETINYEISKVTRSTVNPIGKVTKLSVAAIIDGTYTNETDKNGKVIRKFNPRTAQEINRFTTIVKQAMGYSADREDVVSVESMALAGSGGWDFEPNEMSWDVLRKEYGKAVANIILIVLVFLFVVRPLIKTVRAASSVDDETKLLEEEEEEYLLDDKGQLILPKPKITTIQEKASGLARENVTKTANILKGWISEV